MELKAAASFQAVIDLNSELARRGHNRCTEEARARLNAVMKAYLQGDLLDNATRNRLPNPREFTERSFNDQVQAINAWLGSCR